MKKLIEKYNDFLSDKYDVATQGEFEWLAPEKFNEYVKPYVKKNLDVLDIGVGTGQTSKIFIDQGVKVVGVDISEKMLSVARSKYHYKELIKYDIEQGLLNIFPKRRFDIIVAIGILEFVKEAKKVLNEMKQLLKKGGVEPYPST